MSLRSLQPFIRRSRLPVALPLLALGLVASLWFGHARLAATAHAGVDDDDGVRILLDLAASASREHRVLAPAGSNAYEFYFSVLELDPSNPAALHGQQALFAQATDELERAINQGELNEAQRELALLREYDADSFKVALLAGKLDAQRQLVVAADEARAAVIQARAAAQSEAR